ncbi:MAG: hypothetical protein ACKE8G_01895 [Methylophagaceae bacterium]
MNHIKFILGMLIFSAASISQAEVISIADPRYDVPNSSAGVLRPTQGMSMTTVEQQFGQTDQKSSPVGEPPITTWVYNDFVVFFERNLVIHSVVPH